MSRDIRRLNGPEGDAIRLAPEKLAAALHADIGSHESDPVAKSSTLPDDSRDRQRQLARALENFQAELVRGTIANAASTPFYMSLWESVDLSQIGGVQDLGTLPIIDRSLYEAMSFHLQPWTGETPPMIRHTGGTTGKPLFRYRSRRDIDYMRQFIRAFGGQNHRPRLTLNFRSDHYHGTSLDLEPDVQSISASLDEDSLKVAIDLMREEFKFAGMASGITDIVGSPCQIVAFTIALLGEGIIPASTSVRAIALVGEYVSTNIQQFVEQHWPAVVLINRLTAAEIMGGATECGSCLAFHVDPHVLAEVVPIDSGKPISDGTGRLLLTELFPFIKHQPLIRYSTGDLVSVTNSNCSAKAPSFIYLGRLSSALVASVNGRSKLLLRSALLRETLETEPTVARMTFPRRQDPRALYIGSPIGRCRLIQTSETKGSVVVEIGAIFNPHLFAARTREIEERFRESILRNNPELSELVDEDRTWTLQVKVRSARTSPDLGPLIV